MTVKLHNHTNRLLSICNHQVRVNYFRLITKRQFLQFDLASTLMTKIKLKGPTT